MGGGGWVQAIIEAVKIAGTIGGAIGNFINAGKIKRQLRRMGVPRYNPAQVSKEYYDILSRLSKRETEGMGAGALATQQAQLSRQADVAQKRMAGLGSAGLAGLYVGLANRGLLNASNELFLRNQDVKRAAEQQYNAVLGTIGGIKQQEAAKKSDRDYAFHSEMYKLLSKLRADSIRAGWTSIGSLFAGGAGGADGQGGSGTIGGFINSLSKQKTVGDAAGDAADTAGVNAGGGPKSSEASAPSGAWSGMGKKGSKFGKVPDLWTNDGWGGWAKWGSWIGG